ncbi:hypothetical protein NDU88_006034 [Pleurodeles waltl]|uniref:Uncharacterized protein n=1 Tax=Pleurodeles waltl TaxID=8319 RepID=A0AAV7TEF2_PLEWA|nr:hypothetical protein NDU88_006034 [Pleurodeles waltl]
MTGRAEATKLSHNRERTGEIQQSARLAGTTGRSRDWSQAASRNLMDNSEWSPLLAQNSSPHWKILGLGWKLTRYRIRLTTRNRTRNEGTLDQGGGRQRQEEPHLNPDEVQKERGRVIEAVAMLGEGPRRSNMASPLSSQKEDDHSDSGNETATSTQSSVILPVITPGTADGIIQLRSADTDCSRHHLMESYGRNFTRRDSLAGEFQLTHNLKAD